VAQVGTTTAGLRTISLHLQYCTSGGTTHRDPMEEVEDGCKQLTRPAVNTSILARGLLSVLN
jgi:hypothetical protein